MICKTDAHMVPGKALSKSVYTYCNNISSLRLLQGLLLPLHTLRTLQIQEHHQWVGLQASSWQREPY